MKCLKYLLTYTLPISLAFAVVAIDPEPFPPPEDPKISDEKYKVVAATCVSHYLDGCFGKSVPVIDPVTSGTYLGLILNNPVFSSNANASAIRSYALTLPTADQEQFLKALLGYWDEAYAPLTDEIVSALAPDAQIVPPTVIPQTGVYVVSNEVLNTHVSLPVGVNQVVSASSCLFKISNTLLGNKTLATFNTDKINNPCHTNALAKLEGLNANINGMVAQQAAIASTFLATTPSNLATDLRNNTPNTDLQIFRDQIMAGDPNFGQDPDGDPKNVGGEGNNTSTGK